MHSLEEGARLVCDDAAARCRERARALAVRMLAQRAERSATERARDAWGLRLLRPITFPTAAVGGGGGGGATAEDASRYDAAAAEQRATERAAKAEAEAAAAAAAEKKGRE
eukprot:7389875-Prymnesium_polylepis.1